MDDQTQNQAPETEAPAATVAPVVDAPVADAPTEPDAQAPETEAPAASEDAHLESMPEPAPEPVQVPQAVVPFIEQRSFGRPSADHPVTVTNVYGA